MNNYSTDTISKHKFWNYAHNISRCKAKTLIGHYGFTEHDLPDIEQELLMELIKKLPHYDPEIARETTFIMRVTEGKIADLISYRLASCRDWKRRNISTKESESLLENIPVNDEIDIYLALDISDFIGKLPKELTEICELLKHYTITEILEEYPISRTAFHHKLKKLKKIFHQHFSNEKFP